MATTHTVPDDTRYPRDPHHQATSSGDLHAPHHGEPGHHGGLHVHVTSLSLLSGVLAILLFLTVVTVAVTYVNLGPLNIWIALGIAVVKAWFVALYFMHLRWDSPFNALAFGAALIFLALFIGISLMDTAEYREAYEPPGGAQVTGAAEQGQ